MEATLETLQVNWSEKLDCYVAVILVTFDGHFETKGFDCFGYSDTRVGAIQKATMVVAKSMAEMYEEQQEYERTKN